MKSLAEEMIGKTVLVTTDQYFLAPDGKQYRAVFGKLRGVRGAEQTLGIKVSARSQDWYAEVGRMVIAGCQIHYVIGCEDVNDGPAADYTTTKHGAVFYDRPSAIYLAGD